MGFKNIIVLALLVISVGSMAQATPVPDGPLLSDIVGVRIQTPDGDNVSKPFVVRGRQAISEVSDRQFNDDLELASMLGAKAAYITCPWDYRLEWTRDRLSEMYYRRNLKMIRSVGCDPSSMLAPGISRDGRGVSGPTQAIESI